MAVLVALPDDCGDGVADVAEVGVVQRRDAEASGVRPVHAEVATQTWHLIPGRDPRAEHTDPRPDLEATSGIDGQCGRAVVKPQMGDADHTAKGNSLPNSCSTAVRNQH